MQFSVIQQARQIFDEVADLPSEQRAVVIAERAAGNSSIAAEVQSLLAASEESDAFREGPSECVARAMGELADATRFSLDRVPGSAVEAVGTRLGPYLLEAQIGKGGFGVVYRALQESPIFRRTAVKVLREGMESSNVLARFDLEREALSLMDHPGIAKILDAGATPAGRPYVVMEYVDGEPITTFCSRMNLDVPARLNLFVQVCRAVQHAHQKGVLHRDIKPANVLVTLHDGVPMPKVIDFGIAKAVGDVARLNKDLTAERGMLGTPEYMSPEQAAPAGRDIDTRSDVYGLGALLYELLAGATPFASSTFESVPLSEVQRILLEDEPPVPSSRVVSAPDPHPCPAPLGKARLSKTIRGELDWIVMKAIAKDRSRRYESPSALAQDIERFLGGEAVSAGPPDLSYRLKKLLRRHRALVIAAAMVVLSLSVGFGGVTAALVQAKKDRDAKGEALLARSAAASLAEQRAAEAQRANIAALSNEEIAKKAVEVFGTRAFMAFRPEVAKGRDISLNEYLARMADLDYSADSPTVEAIVRSNLANMHLLRGSPRRASDELDIAMGRFEDAGGSATDWYADAWKVRARISYVLGDAAVAEDAARHAYLMRCQLHGLDSIASLESASDLADALAETGKPEESIRLTTTALTTLEGLPQVSRTPYLRSHLLQSRAQANLYLGRLSKSAADVSEALQLCRSCNPVDDVCLANTLSVVSELEIRRGRRDAARAAAQEALDLRTGIYPSHHPCVAAAQCNLGTALARCGDLEAGLRLLKTAIESMRQAYGSNSVYIANPLTSLATVLRGLHRTDESMACLNEAIRTYQLIGVPVRRSFAAAVSMRGELLIELGRFDEGEDDLMAAMQFQSGPDVDRDAAYLTARRMMYLCDSTQRCQDYDAWRQFAILLSPLSAPNQ